MINFLIYHHSQKYSFTRRPNTQLYMQFACYRKQKIKKFINPQSRQQQNASPSTPTPPHPLKPNQPGDSNAPRRPLPTPSASTQTLSTRRQQRASPSASTYIGSTSHIQHRSIHTQVNNLTPPQPRTPLKKSPRGVQRGRGFTAPLRFSFFPKKEYIV